MQTNWQGITTYQTVTPAKGQLMGGWVKLKTSKGKTLLERIEQRTDVGEILPVFLTRVEPSRSSAVF